MSSGTIVVADTGNNRVQFFNPDGTFAGKVGRGGTDLGEFTAPTAAVEISDSTFAIADQGNDRVQVLNLVPRP